MKNGFTLIEMVVVMVVMAVAAHLAVREFSRLRERQLAETADVQLEELRDAVWSLDSGGAPRGFLSDMGRMPRSLEELWTLPNDARRFAVTNVESGVYVPTGWNGPYLRLAPGKSALYDPWGNDIHAITNSQGFVTNVFHMGSSGQLRTRSRDVSLLPIGGDEASLVVALDTVGSGSVAIRLYAPDGFGGVTNFTATATAAEPAHFEGLTPGRRIISCAGVGTKIVNLKPGDNLTSLRAPVSGE